MYTLLKSQKTYSPLLEATQISTNFEQKDTTTEEWIFNIWTDNRDWCTQCNQKNNKLLFDDQTKTTTCTQCKHTQTYTDKDWKNLQTQRHITYQYMPGKYFFNNLSGDEIFKKYLREYNHVEWSSWLIHDYILAKMKDDKTTQEKLLEIAKVTVEKMNYDPKTWTTLFEKMDTKDKEIFYQVPQITYEAAKKKIQETTPKEEHHSIMEAYLSNIVDIYFYNRWKGDRVACWVTNEIIKLCDTESNLVEIYTELFSCDPLIETFQEDILTAKKHTINLTDSYIQWQLRLSDKYLSQSKAFVAVQAAYEALGAKLGIHAIWPPTKVLPFDIQTVKRVSAIVNDPELFRFYDLSTELDAVDNAKACYYAKHFIEKIKEILPKVTSIEQEQAKQGAYIT